MEAVGQLTGGVAHDFNNLLTVIQGNAELLVDKLGPENSEARAILRSAGRGAELTQRLLAFARQQPLSPRAIDLAALTAEMSELLKRVLGERILVLEDDEEVRVLVVEMLERLGYRVISVMTAAAARPLLAEVDLVLSDVVLSGSTSGPELAAEAWSIDPDRKFFFMSGYPADGVSRGGPSGADTVLLNKPFEVGTLARALRQALELGEE